MLCGDEALFATLHPFLRFCNRLLLLPWLSERVLGFPLPLRSVRGGRPGGRSHHLGPS